MHAPEGETCERVRTEQENAILFQPMLTQDIFNLDIFLTPVYLTCLTDLKGCLFQVFFRSLWNPHVLFASTILLIQSSTGLLFYLERFMFNSMCFAVDHYHRAGIAANS